MAKVAFLVDYSIRTRVIVDIPDDVNPTEIKDNDPVWEKIVETANEDVKTDPSVFCYDNVMQIEEDMECPFGTFEFDK